MGHLGMVDEHCQHRWDPHGHGYPIPSYSIQHLVRLEAFAHNHCRTPSEQRGLHQGMHAPCVKEGKVDERDFFGLKVSFNDHTLIDVQKSRMRSMNPFGS